MRIKPMKEAIMLSRDAGVTVWLWSHRGMGKSQITQQTAVDNKMGFSDMRLGQCEASDVRGMPWADKEEMVTRFLAPADLPQGGMSWGEYMGELGLLKALEAAMETKQVVELLESDPAIIENPD